MKPLLTGRSLSAVALAVLLGGVGLRALAPASDATAAEAATAPSSSGEGVRREYARREAARTAHGASHDAIEANGAAPTPAEATLVEEAEMAAQNRAQRFETNVRDLRQAAAQAAAEGQPERAALMQLRAEALSDRAAAESGAD
jgi:hypothetical protein